MSEKVKITGIYCILCKTSEKMYIGYANDIYGRWRVHLRKLRNNIHDNAYLQNSWNKYTESDFDFSIVEECSKEDLKERERYYIKEWRTKFPSGLNLTDGGDGLINPTDETKSKISETLKLKWEDEEFRKAQPSTQGRNFGNLGRKASEETKRKLSLSHMGISTWNKGRKMTEEEKALSNLTSFESGHIPWNKGTMMTEEEIKKHTDARRNKQDKNKRKNSTSKYKGVSKLSTGMFAAKIYFNSEYYCLGNFPFEAEAAQCYNEAALFFFGWKAVLNDIPQSELDEIWNS